MGSKKRSVRARRISAFKSQLGDAGDTSDVFAREKRRREQLSREREAQRRKRACETKNRYATRIEAEAAIAACEEHGALGLHCYRCPWCSGWHLTSKPQGSIERTRAPTQM